MKLKKNNILIGDCGTGKTTLAFYLAKTNNLRYAYLGPKNTYISDKKDIHQYDKTPKLTTYRRNSFFLKDNTIDENLIGDKNIECHFEPHSNLNNKEKLEIFFKQLDIICFEGLVIIDDYSFVDGFMKGHKTILNHKWNFLFIGNDRLLDFDFITYTIHQNDTQILNIYSRVDLNKKYPQHQHKIIELKHKPILKEIDKAFKAEKSFLNILKISPKIKK